MNNIEVKILNPEVVAESRKMMVCSARLTQRGHNIKNLDDFMNLYNKPNTDALVQSMVALPHPTIQKLGVINLVIVGASRRFLAQITRHQNEVKFVSASLQYSDYSGNAEFMVPYEILQQENMGLDDYLKSCKKSMNEYQEAIKNGLDHDSAGYLMPQGLRNVLIISATPYQLKHMIKQRTCRRNTSETRYVMLRIWEELYKLDPVFFGGSGPFCTTGPCQEGKMCCKRPIPKYYTPGDILDEDFPLIRGGKYEG